MLLVYGPDTATPLTQFYDVKGSSFLNTGGFWFSGLLDQMRVTAVTQSFCPT